jgi:hypothetical protein
MPRLVTRRRVLKAVAALWASAASGACYANGVGSDAPLLNRQLRTIFGDPRDAERIGEAYLAQRPQEADPDFLVRTVYAVAGRLSRLNGCEWRDRVSAAVRRDFAQGATVSLQGWILSTTEARLCALAAIHAFPAKAVSNSARS